MILRAVHPTGFDFSNSIVTRPRQVIKSATEMNEIAIDNLGAVADQETMVKISEVRDCCERMAEKGRQPCKCW